MDVSKTYCGNHSAMYVRLIIMLYTLTLYSVLCPLYLNKLGRKKTTEIVGNSNLHTATPRDNHYKDYSLHMHTHTCTHTFMKKKNEIRLYTLFLLAEQCVMSKFYVHKQTQDVFFKYHNYYYFFTKFLIEGL